MAQSTTENVTGNARISIVIPAYNAETTIAECVQSILRGEHAPFEIIVVDDCSTDRTVEIVEELHHEFPNVVKIIQQDINGGPARARNAGARAADGEFYFFMDSDTVILPDALARFAERIQEADSVSGIYHHEPAAGGAGARFKAMLNYYTFSRHGVFEYEVFNGAVGGIHAHVFDELGGYNEDLQWGMDYENEEFGHRLAQNHRAIMDPAICVRHAFPGIPKLTQLYFSRVSLWVELFLRRRKFEPGGPAEGRTGLATLAVPAMIVTIPLVWYGAAGGLVPGCFLALYLYGYGGFFAFVARQRPGFLPLAVLLSLYFSLAISAGALYGVVRVALGRGRVQAGSNLARHPDDLHTDTS